MKKNPIGRLRLIPVWLSACVVTACSGGSDGDTKPAPTPIATNKPVKAAASNDTRVKAVQTSRNEPLVDLQFELTARPETGKPVSINLYLMGLGDATDLQLSLSSRADLEVVSGAQANFATLKTGETLTHTVAVKSGANGIFVLDLQLTASVESRPRTLSFAIPVAFVPSNPP